MMRRRRQQQIIQEIRNPYYIDIAGILFAFLYLSSKRCEMKGASTLALLHVDRHVCTAGLALDRNSFYIHAN